MNVTAIKIGGTRVQLNNIAYVEGRTSEWLYRPAWSPDELQEDVMRSTTYKHETGTVASIVFSSAYGGEEGGGVLTLNLYGDEADEFLLKYDQLTVASIPKIDMKKFFDV